MMHVTKMDNQASCIAYKYNFIYMTTLERDLCTALLGSARVFLRITCWISLITPAPVSSLARPDPSSDLTVQHALWVYAANLCPK